MMSCIAKPIRFKRLTKQQFVSFLKGCQSLKELKQIHAQLFRVGFHQSKDTVDKFMAFCTDPNHGSFQYAKKIFDYVENPSLFAYNLMIKSYVRQGSLRQAISLFYCLKEDGLWPDNFTYPFVLKAIACLKIVSVGKKFHGIILKTGLEFDSYVSNSLMDMYAEVGCVQYLYKLFNKMRNRDLVTWNIMISGLVRCRRFGEAVAVYRQMEEEGLLPDEATLVSTLSACTALGDLDLGKEIHDYVNRKLEFSIILGNSLLDMYFKCGSGTMAQSLFNDMPVKNEISWTTMVSGYLNCGQLDKARELFRMSPTKDVVSWTAMINGCVQYKEFEEALALFSQMQVKKIKADKYTIVSLLTVCAHLGALEQGVWIHELIEESSIRIDAFVGTALIDMYAKCGCIEKSMKVFRKIDEKDTTSWTAIICGLATNGQTSKALDLFSEMISLGTKPDHITFVGVLTACTHAGLVEEGWKYLLSMRKIYNLDPKIEHYGCFIDLLGRAGFLEEAEQLIETIPKHNEVFPLWVSLLAACRVHGNVEMGERVAKQVGDIKSCDSGTHALLANIYAAADRWEDMTKVRKKMKDLGVKKFPGCSSIGINGTIYEFLVGDTSALEVRENYSLLNDTSRIMALRKS